ncbi:hypothetical protein ASPWEDRAFT_436547 [Aspergillus wentii DTO 134E9]|uniref:Uncharacterized protein n=1 Tax=Aspergillus wentii DTO 134E9 TaxID=1073089 RepID=A0A1L9RPS6_ASPWE|nr:uncharacterized protein ASPWEDRAFT_436547 [Aspergillus wentii DTO 134E9]OJJ36941.1 hypothetical protein ASPWEDRAFT_436547 [Aspergillus wentii DTO 134E9]
MARQKRVIAKLLNQSNVRRRLRQHDEKAIIYSRTSRRIEIAQMGETRGSRPNRGLSIPRAGGLTGLLMACIHTTSFCPTHERFSSNSQR